jgi:hypothetical protein
MPVIPHPNVVKSRIIIKSGKPAVSAIHLGFSRAGGLPVPAEGGVAAVEV